MPDAVSCKFNKESARFEPGAVYLMVPRGELAAVQHRRGIGAIHRAGV